MKFCDLTMAYNAKSGGIKTYIDEKRRFLREHTDHEHLLIIPGSRDRVRRSERSATITLRGPLLPGQDVYRAFLSPRRIRELLMRERPDVIELGSYYTEPWAAFSYRRRQHEQGHACTVGAYFHTDVAQTYIAAPLRALAQSWLEDVSETLAIGVERMAEVAAAGAEKYIGYVFNHCDVAMAASIAQAERLAEYGVEETHVVPMGVDLRLFHPRRRSEALRAANGAGPESTVLMYAGRLCNEKRVLNLIEAFRKLPKELDVRLWMLGDGPQREEIESAAHELPAIRLLPYESERSRFAATLASADVYLSAGPFETFALSVIEAQACGLPVVGVDAGALRERVPAGMGFLGPVDDASAMVTNIMRAADDRKAIGWRARLHVEQHFSWPTAFSKLLRCYGVSESSLDRPPAAHPPEAQANAG
jgi:alpha-1,6-mannosyltransferase